MIRQLRSYEVFDETKVAFLERFRDHASRIMATYGFRIIAGWETSTADGRKFAYLLEWPDETTMKDRWAQPSAVVRKRRAGTARRRFGGWGTDPAGLVRSR